MNPRVKGSIGATFLALAALGCDLSTEPAQRLVDVSLDFCATDNVVWFAYENESDPLVVMPVNAQSTFAFAAKNHVAIALVRQNGADYHTEIFFTTNSELEEISGLTCLEEGGSKSLNGSVSGIVTGQVGVVGMNFSSVLLTASGPFTLTQLNDRPLDLVASRQTLSSAIQMTDRIIIRRGVNLASGSTMPALNFDGTEFVLAATPSANVVGIAASEQAQLQNTFITAQETSNTLSVVLGIADGATSFAAVPAASLVAGDNHHLFALAFDNAVGGVRGIERIFGAPADQALLLGPALSTPTVSTLTTSPYVRLRAVLPAQLSYDGAIIVRYEQQHGQFSVTTVTLTASIAYFGVVNTWLLDIPNLASVEGWQNAWALQSGGGAINWTVSAYAVRPELLLGALPEDGETARFASRSSTASPAVVPLALRGGRASALRPRLFAPAR